MSSVISVGGYLWLVLYRNVSVQNMKSELMDSFGIVLVIYMLILLFSDLRRILSGAIRQGFLGGA